MTTALRIAAGRHCSKGLGTLGSQCATRDKGRILNRKYASNHEDDTPAECSMSNESTEMENKLLSASPEVKLQRECPENLRCYCSLTRTTCSRFPDTFFFSNRRIWSLRHEFACIFFYLLKSFKKLVPLLVTHLKLFWGQSAHTESKNGLYRLRSEQLDSPPSLAWTGVDTQS